MSNIHVGLDIGSVSVKLAAFYEGINPGDLSGLIHSERFFIDSQTASIFPNGAVFFSRSIRHQGDPSQTADTLLDDLRQIPHATVHSITCTGSSGHGWMSRSNFNSVNAFKAAAEGIRLLHPDVRTIFEMGGEHTRFIRIEQELEEVRIEDYGTNGECAAGTGLFFDQQARRLKFRVEDTGEAVLSAKRTAPIAGRCSVFAKSDMIHAQQRGYQPDEVLKGLCEAVSRSFKGSVTKGKRIETTVALIGGMAANPGLVETMRQQFTLDGELIVPRLHDSISALGALSLGLKKASVELSQPFNPTSASANGFPTTAPLSMSQVRLLRDEANREIPPDRGDAFLGIDIGSVSTNLALIAPDGSLIEGVYRMTDGRPIEVVKDAIHHLALRHEKRFRILGVGTTGSGRELIGALVGADVVKDEITAHATGAIFMGLRWTNQAPDTIFEIGGQDSKFISLREGAVVDFSLNEACAAGTGSFLEEQAQCLGISIRDEFASLALSSNRPLKLGERCTVFMEKELIPYLQQGVSKKDILAGLALSVAQNYLNRVVKKRPIGRVVFFQGGTAYNDAVAAAFATLLDREIIVPPHNGIMGAIGAALLVKTWAEGKNTTRFRGWDLNRVQYAIREFQCGACSNQCQIQEFRVEDEITYWGDKCSEKFRRRVHLNRPAAVPDLFRFRDDLLFQEENVSLPGPVIGIPRVLYFFDRFPFWRAYFQSLGMSVNLSPPSRTDLLNKGSESSAAEPCFPIQAAHGHVSSLIGQTDYLFCPNVVNEESPVESPASFLCPWGQTLPLVLRHGPIELEKIRLLDPTIQFRQGRTFVQSRLGRSMKALGVSSKANRIALDAAYDAQQRFRCAVQQKGRETMDLVRSERLPGVVLLGRPYVLYDSGLNLNLPAKLREQFGVNVIPMDFLPSDLIDIRGVHDHMFWNYGRRILQAARWVRDYPNLHLIFFSFFKCGPDSYIRHFIEDAAMKPFLFLQFDGHANDAGMMTRLEAFLESRGML
jgi:predicted CoA-substrate-specific enzyme activase